MLDTNSSLSFTDGAGNDKPFSLVWCGKANTTAQRLLIYKSNPDHTDTEYELLVNPVSLTLYGSDIFDRIGRSGVFNPTLAYSTIISTYSGSKTIGGIKVYADGARIDDTDLTYVTYAGMTPTSSKVSNNRSSYIGDYKGAVIAIIAEELTASQVKQIDAVLRSYCGVDAVSV